MSKRKLDDILLDKEDGVQLRLMFLSNMELGTKLSGPEITYNIGDYLPADKNIGTTYVKTVFIPAQTIDKYMREGSGPRIGRIVNGMFDSMHSLENKLPSPIDDRDKLVGIP